MKFAIILLVTLGLIALSQSAPAVDESPLVAENADAAMNDLADPNCGPNNDNSEAATSTAEQKTSQSQTGNGEEEKSKAGKSKRGKGKGGKGKGGKGKGKNDENNAENE